MYNGLKLQLQVLTIYYMYIYMYIHVCVYIIPAQTLYLFRWTLKFLFMAVIITQHMDWQHSPYFCDAHNRRQGLH